MPDTADGQLRAAGSAQDLDVVPFTLRADFDRMTGSMSRVGTRREDDIGLYSQQPIVFSSRWTGGGEAA